MMIIVDDGLIVVSRIGAGAGAAHLSGVSSVTRLAAAHQSVFLRQPHGAAFARSLSLSSLLGFNT